MRSGAISKPLELFAVIGTMLVSGCNDERGPEFAADAKFVGLVPQPSSIVGRDGADSALLWGHSVWAFGDTVLALGDTDGTNWHHNSFSTADDLDASDGIGGLTERTDNDGAPLYFIARTDDEAAFNAAHRGDPCAESPCGARWAAWPGTMVFDAARNRALISYGLIYAEPGAFNFGSLCGDADWSCLIDCPPLPHTAWRAVTKSVDALRAIQLPDLPSCRRASDQIG